MIQIVCVREFIVFDLLMKIISTWIQSWWVCSQSIYSASDFLSSIIHYLQYWRELHKLIYSFYPLAGYRNAILDSKSGSNDWNTNLCGGLLRFLFCRKNFVRSIIFCLESHTFICHKLWLIIMKDDFSLKGSAQYLGTNPRLSILFNETSMI